VIHQLAEEELRGREGERGGNELMKQCAC
jgi:hypothetical protein